MAGTPVTFEVLQDGFVLETHNVILGDGGSYSLETSVEGEFELRAKVTHWLSAVELVDESLTADFSLVNGDITGDNQININDFIQVRQNYNKVGVGDNPADINGDGNINVLDYIILRRNYNKIGE